MTKPVLVLAMPKVGNTTVIEALRQAGIEVHRAHFLSDRSFWQALARIELSGDEHRVQEFLDWNERLRKLAVRRFDGRGCRVITLVRDPVARNVSWLFESSSMKDPDFVHRFHDDPDGMDALKKRFLEDQDHDHPLRWFDYEIRDVFGIDVFAKPFPRDAGYATYSRDEVDLLLLRLEDVSRSGPAALGAFLELDDIDLASRNVRGETPVGRLYERFSDWLTLPDEYLDRVYTSRLVRHFYSREEIDAFRRRWSTA